MMFFIFEDIPLVVTVRLFAEKEPPFPQKHARSTTSHEVSDYYEMLGEISRTFALN